MRNVGDCSVEGCDRLQISRQLCKAHYRRFLKHGDPLAHIPIKPRQRDETISHGYRFVTVPEDLRHLAKGKAKELEHRLVMAQHLDRPLTADESVHHLNGDRLDNRIENLELWSRWQPNGQRLADKIAHARELLERYGSDAPE